MRSERISDLMARAHRVAGGSVGMDRWRVDRGETSVAIACRESDGNIKEEEGRREKERLSAAAPSSGPITPSP